MLRFSSIGKADMELCLPVLPQREGCGPIQPGTGNTCECADARGMFSLRVDCVCMSHGMLSRMVVFAYVAPEWLGLMNKHIHTHSVWKPAFPQLLPLFDMWHYELQLSHQQAVPCSGGTTDYKKDGSFSQL